MEIWKQLVVKQLTVNGRSKLVQQLLKDIDAERECDQQVTAAVDGAGESIRVTIASLGGACTVYYSMGYSCSPPILKWPSMHIIQKNH